MNLEFIYQNLPITEEEKRTVDKCIEQHDGFIYFHRIPVATQATVIYATNELIRLFQETGFDKILVDFTGRALTTQKMRRLMMQRMQKTFERVSLVVIVLDSAPFRRVVIDFFVRAYLLSRGIEVQFFESKSEGIAFLKQRISEQ